ncbi:MAG: hypothetical protein F4244_12165 [Gammaproteobacteria bacterium]|nr:hypothetical protein [Gammaproteobacteria bacterium]
MGKHTKAKEPGTDELERLIREAAGRKMTPEEKRAQRITYVMSIAEKDDEATRKEVERIVDGA